MRIYRHCDETLPGGERLWRRLARMAGYSGDLYVRGYGTDDYQNLERAIMTRTIVRGFTAFTKDKTPLGIVVYLGRPDALCAMWYPREVDAVSTFCHELGHAWAARHGKPMRSSGYRYHTWRKMRQERNADKYGARLMARYMERYGQPNLGRDVPRLG